VRIGLLLCGDLPDSYSAIAGDYGTLVDAMFDDGNVSIEVFAAHRGSLPSHPKAFDGFIISGSASSVYDDEQWIRDLEGCTRELVASGVGVFGLCFGHQVLAQALGGRVERATQGWGVGVHAMSVVEDRPWMRPRAERLQLVMAHQDQVIELPEGAVLLGSSDHCPNFLVAFTDTAVGIQGHPEFPAVLAQAIYEDKRDILGRLATDAIASLAIDTDTQRVASWIAGLFALAGGSQSQYLA